MIEARTKPSGFTLIELIVVITIIGALAVAALPRFFDQSVFETRGFYDETLSILRYAQKTAVAQRRMVCASFTSTKVTLTVASNFAGACDTDVSGPSGPPPYHIKAHGSAQFNPIPTSLSFNPDGSASAGAIIQVNGASSAITVVQETGYVY